MFASLFLRSLEARTSPDNFRQLFIRHLEIVAVRLKSGSFRRSSIWSSKDAAPVEVGRMTKAELGEILRERGITRDSMLRRILDQADGRPAWAVRLGLQTR